MKTIEGKTYVKVPAQVDGSCIGCAAQHDGGLCEKLHTGENGVYTPDICASVNKIFVFKEQTMNDQKEKTALELVDDLMNASDKGATIYGLAGGLRLIKSAIERERDANEITIDGLEELVKSNTRTIQDMNDRLKSAITMRPISELPGKVPDGCLIVAVGKLRVTIKCWVWEPGDDVFPHEGETHFYILPLPKPDRRLHPCYMPGCGNEVVVLRDGEDGYRVECRKCGSTGPLRASKEGAEQSWGYAE